MTEDVFERELDLVDERSLFVADSALLGDDEAGATTWDCGLVLAHYLIKQHEMGEVGTLQVLYCVVALRPMQHMPAPMVQRGVAVAHGVPCCRLQSSQWWLGSACWSLVQAQALWA